MNTTLRNQAISALAAAAALCAGACSDSSGEPAEHGDTATYGTRDGRFVDYAVAPEARLADVEVTAAGGRTIIHITTGAPISPAGGPLAIEVHFSDRREVAFVRNFAYPSPDPFDRAAVLDVRTGAVLGKVDVAVHGSGLELAFDSALVTGQPRLAVSRYLPSRAAVDEARGGLEDAYVDMVTFGAPNPMHAVRSVARARDTMDVAVPFAGARRARSTSRAAGDVHFGPPPGTTNYEPTTPVIQIPSGAGTINVVDHDSDWPDDGDYDTGYKGVCDKPILCGWFTWTARVSFIGGCGSDLDGDSQLDGNEVQWYFGYCAFPSALNDTWQDRRGYVHWRNVGRGDDAGEVYEYIAAPTTGQIGVWYSNNRGRTWDSLYRGPALGGPGGWQFFPAPPQARPPATC